MTSVKLLCVSLTCTLCFMVNLSCPSSTPLHEEPIIYVTFTRWENRTFSPRIYYLLMKRYGLEQKLLDQYKYANTNRDYPGILKPLTATASTSPTQDIGDRSAFPVINNPGKRPLRLRPPIIIDDRKPLSFQATGIVPQEQHFLFIEPQEMEPVVFPNNAATQPPTYQKDNFFSDRIAYPGVSIRRTSPPPVPVIPLGNRNDPVLPLKESEFTDEDIVDTVQLTLDIIKQSEWQDENYVFSPLSITNILALLLLGANGTSYDELSHRLRPNNPFRSTEIDTEVRFHNAFRNLITLLTRTGNTDVTIDICNRILGDKKYPIMDSYRYNAISYYDAQSDTFDFSTQGREVQNSVNKWVSHKTAGKIPGVIASPPGPETTVMLVNAIYFKGNWEVPFISKLTRPKPFYVSPTETIDVQMMANILTIPYLATKNFRVIGLPYKGSKVGLFIFLPNTPGVKGLSEMEKHLTVDNLKIINSMKLTPVTLQLPKMKVEGDDHLKDLLQKFGLKSIFNPKTANFSRLSDNPGMFISSILHKAVFEMNERGSEAAAATIATGDRNLDERPILFAVNRPFAFTIYNIKAKSILFFGRVTRPSSV